MTQTATPTATQATGQTVGQTAGQTAGQSATMTAGETRSTPRSFQEIILRLQGYWAAQGCAIMQPYDMEVGAGTFHPATTLRSLGSKPWAAAYVQPSRRPTDGRYGENPNRLQHYYQFQALIKPSPPNLQELYLGSLEAIGVDMALHDIRFVEDDWESPTLGAWGLGWEVWCDGMEVSQFTYFQQVGGHDCHPVSGELTYGLERLAMYVLGVDHVMDMPFNDPQSPIPLTYGDIFLQTEQEYARWNFDVADTDTLLQHFKDAEAECARILALDDTDPKTGRRIIMAHPAYDQAIKASHVFNLLDARGVISVTERQAYILKVRALARDIAMHIAAANPEDIESLLKRSLVGICPDSPFGRTTLHIPSPSLTPISLQPAVKVKLLSELNNSIFEPSCLIWKTLSGSLGSTLWIYSASFGK